MTFVHPSWVTGLLIWICYYIPFFICVILAIYGGYSFIRYDGYGNDKERKKAERGVKMFTIFIILSFVLLIGCQGIGGYLWHESFEVPSVQDKVVTVESWQPKAGISTNSKGIMTIDNADQLMLVTTEGESFLNEENFLFQKFDTRDILNDVKPGSVVRLHYYGWREGFNSGFPNILSAEVIDDSHAVNKTISDYFGSKIV